MVISSTNPIVAIVTVKVRQRVFYLNLYIYILQFNYASYFIDYLSIITKGLTRIIR